MLRMLFETVSGAFLRHAGGERGMKLQHNFYDKLHAEIQAEIACTDQPPIPEDVLLHPNHALERAYRHLEESARNYKKVRNKEKYKAFRRLSRRALELAAFLPANITVETKENGEGIIFLEAGILLLTSDEEEYTQTIAQLFTTASHIFYDAPENALPHIEFTFTLYDEIKR